MRRGHASGREIGVMRNTKERPPTDRRYRRSVQGVGTTSPMVSGRRRDGHTCLRVRFGDAAMEHVTDSRRVVTDSGHQIRQVEGFVQQSRDEAQRQ